MRYSAVFALDDPEALVDAGLSCPACLSGSVCLLVEVGADGRARCADCGGTWSLRLEPQQILRLSLAPPPAADVRFLRTSGVPPEA